jgi:peptidyl-prolyl cis-trans isomerase A (cyclophilin A)
MSAVVVHCSTMKTLLAIVFLALVVSIRASEDAQFGIANVSEEVVSLFWIPPEDPDHPIKVGEIPPGEGVRMDTFVGHAFLYEVDGQRHIASVESTRQPAVVIGPTHFQVECTTTTGTLHAHILPEWSPFGAARFLQLVNIGYFDGCALNRVVPNFLTQFGISKDYEMRTSFHSETILDDDPIEGIHFQPGYMAYAGSGPNSRTTEMFIVMPNARASQLQAFGNNPWETAFGYVEPQDVESVVSKWYAYGDMPPWGTGPDPQNIYREDGYEYLKTSFPEMSYIEKCAIVSSDYGGASEEEEL